MAEPMDMERAVVELLADSGDVGLPALTREEFRALGDEPVLADAEDERWWSELDEPARRLVAETAQRGLLVRGLLVASEIGDPAPDGSHTGL